jgi:hypothetical protein
MKLTDSISTEASLAALDRNATACKQTDWRGMEIGASQGAIESDPFRQFARDEGSAKRDRLHQRLDLLMAERGDFTPASRTKLHTALDAMIAKASGRDEDEPDEDDDEEENGESEIVGEDEDFRRLNNAVADFGRAVQRADVGSPARSSGTGRTYAADADLAVVNSHLRPGMTVQQAKDSLQNSLYSRQKNGDRQAAWSGLVHYLQTQPETAQVRTCNPAILAPLIRELEKNRLAPDAKTVHGKTRLQSWGKGHLVN